MVNHVAIHAWVRKSYEIVVDQPEGKVLVDGIALGTVPLGLHFRNTDYIDVTHIPSGKRVWHFTSLGAALDFTQRVAHMVLWGREHPVVPEQIFQLAREIEASAHRPRMLP
jgi:hypothetical protein